MALLGIFGLLIVTLSRSLFNVFYICLDLGSSNWIKIGLDSSSRILESCPLVSYWLFLYWWLWISLCSMCQVCRKTIFCSFVMFEFFLRSTLFCFYYSLNIVDSPTLVFILIVPGQFEQVLPNLSSFDQSTVSSSLRKLVKLKKSKRHSRSFVWKLIFEPSCVLFVFICLK